LRLGEGRDYRSGVSGYHMMWCFGYGGVMSGYERWCYVVVCRRGGAYVGGWGCKKPPNRVRSLRKVKKKKIYEKSLKGKKKKKR